MIILPPNSDEGESRVMAVLRLGSTRRTPLSYVHHSLPGRSVPIGRSATVGRPGCEEPLFLRSVSWYATLCVVREPPTTGSRSPAV